jgi:hypothetical protein
VDCFDVPLEVCSGPKKLPAVLATNAVNLSRVSSQQFLPDKHLAAALDRALECNVAVMLQDVVLDFVLGPQLVRAALYPTLQEPNIVHISAMVVHRIPVVEHGIAAIHFAAV